MSFVKKVSVSVLIPSSEGYARSSAAISVCSSFIPEPELRTPEWLVTAFEDAGRTLQAMPSRGCRPNGYGNNWPDMVHDAKEAYGWMADRMRPAYPNAQDIARMDEIYSWIGLIPESQRLLRRIVMLRSLVNPITDRHRFSWRKVARVLGHDDKSTKAWHSKAIGTILVEFISL